MDKDYKSKIYERLLEIKFKVDIYSSPDPQAINEKIGQCHALIEEIEYFSIQINREISAIQQAYNNATATFEIKKDTLLTQEPIKNLPNIKDREAQANLLLRKDKDTIKNYQNELTDLNNLLKSVTLKAKNLNRANGDIKLQLRVLEAQIKLNVGPATSPAVKSLMEEFNKGISNEDSFQDISTSITEEVTIDPSESSAIDKLLDDEIIEQKTNITKSSEDFDKLLNDDPIPDLDVYKDEFEQDWTENEKIKNLNNDMSDTEVNMDEIIDLTPEKEEDIEQNIDISNNQKEDQTKKDEVGIDIDDLLNNF